MTSEEAHRGLIPYLNVRDAWRALEWYKKAFDAQVAVEIKREGDKLAHAELRIGSARFMMREEYLAYNFRSPATVNGTTINLLVYVDDVEAITERAVAEGAKLIRPIEKQFHGDLMSEIEDPFGHSWFLTQHVQDMTPDELKATAAQARL